MSERARTIVVWAACGFLIACCAASGLFVVASHVRELRTFRPVDATVVESTVRDGPGRGLNYAAHVRFRYEVGGIAYESSTHRSWDWSSETEDRPRAIAARYPVGSRQTAWHDPMDPSYAVLTRELNVVALALSLLACALPIAILVSHHRAR